MGVVVVDGGAAVDGAVVVMVDGVVVVTVVSPAVVATLDISLD